jgi:hypothetical protein
MNQNNHNRGYPYQDIKKHYQAANYDGEERYLPLEARESLPGLA